MNFDQGLAYETAADHPRSTKTHPQKDGKENHDNIRTRRQTPSMFALWVSYGLFRAIRARTDGHPQLTLLDLWPSCLFRTTYHPLTQTSQCLHSRIDHTTIHSKKTILAYPFLLIGRFCSTTTIPSVRS